MANLISFFEVVILLINIFSIIVLCSRIVFCVISLIRILAARISKAEKFLSLQQTKTELGGFLLLGLEILIVADIIGTIIHPTLDDIIRLAAIVAIRTVISFFLNKEIKGTTYTAERIEQ